MLRTMAAIAAMSARAHRRPASDDENGPVEQSEAIQV